MTQQYNEEIVIEKLHNPDTMRQAFGQVVEHYGERLYWQIRKMVVSHEDADDLLQNTFLKAWSNIDKFRGDAQVSTWLYRIAINETLNFLAKNENTVPLDSPEGSIAEQLESDTYFCGDRADALFQEAVNRLPDKQRLTFNMKYFENMKYEEISSILGTSVGALKASYHIAVNKIEDFLKDKD